MHFSRKISTSILLLSFICCICSMITSCGKEKAASTSFDIPFYEFAQFDSSFSCKDVEKALSNENIQTYKKDSMGFIQLSAVATWMDVKGIATFTFTTDDKLYTISWGVQDSSLGTLEKVGVTEKFIKDVNDYLEQKYGAKKNAVMVNDNGEKLNDLPGYYVYNEGLVVMRSTDSNFNVVWALSEINLDQLSSDF